MVVGVVLPAVIAFAAFRAQRTLFDAATPAVGLMLLFGVLLVLTLTEATRQKKALERIVQVQREETARIAGELEAARRIQTATLPRADLLEGDARIDIAATMIPARETGGDLYDYFRLDERRLFFLVGDVAGKGLSASIFMAVSKALYKSAPLRASNADIGELMSAANAEVSRDNPEMLFVTAFAGILDLETGHLQYCNAGHENPFLIHDDDARVRRIEDGDVLPMCGERFRLPGCAICDATGRALCTVTDGVTKPRTASAPCGSARVEAILPGSPRRTTAGVVVDGLRAAWKPSPRARNRGRPHDPRVAVARSPAGADARRQERSVTPEDSRSRLALRSADDYFPAGCVAPPRRPSWPTTPFPRPTAWMFSGAIPLLSGRRV
jgi:hypothetical protein